MIVTELQFFNYVNKNVMEIIWDRIDIYDNTLVWENVRNKVYEQINQIGIDVWNEIVEAE